MNNPGHPDLHKASTRHQHCEHAEPGCDAWT